jgi:NADPH:quinone reductase-like Zn-dependent oxidoreductase
MGIPTAYEIEPERPGRILTGIAHLVDAGVLTPKVSHRFALEQVAEGHRLVELGHTIGKIVTTVKP